MKKQPKEEASPALAAFIGKKLFGKKKKGKSAKDKKLEMAK